MRDLVLNSGGCDHGSPTGRMNWRGRQVETGNDPRPRPVQPHALSDADVSERDGLALDRQSFTVAFARRSGRRHRRPGSRANSPS